MKKKILLLIFFCWMLSLSAAHIEYLNEDLQFKIFNKKNGKIMNYYEVDPGAKLEAKLFGVDQISLYTRVVSPVDNETYQYGVKVDGETRDIVKNITTSDISKGLNGENISAYNKYVSNLNSYNSRFVFSNDSKYKLLIKLVGNNVIADKKNIEFVNYNPSAFETEKTLKLDNKEYTYYTSNGKKIELVLEGPVTLKIMSRLIFEYNYVNSQAYRYNIYDNGSLHSSFNDTAYKSDTAIIKELPEMIPSNGDKNILKLTKGVHHIIVEDGDQNRDLMFRFYISKSAIGIRN